MALANPRRDRISITDLPVQTLLRLLHCSSNSRIAVAYDLSHRIHVSRLEPRLFNIFCVFVSEDPIELVAVTESVLDQMHIVADPDVDAFLLDEFSAERIVLQIVAFEVRAKAGVARRFRFIFKTEDEFTGGGFDTLKITIQP